MKLLKNIANTQVGLPDFGGITIESGDSVPALVLGEHALIGSEDVARALLDGTLVLEIDGTPFYGTAAVAEILGVSPQRTRDGKEIFLASDRPKDHYRCYGGSADGAQIWGGAPLLYAVQPGETVSHDLTFLDDVYLRDGVLIYKNGALGTTFTISVICPQGAPLPVEGNPAAPVDMVIFNFVRGIFMYGDNEFKLDTPEPFLLRRPYFARLSVYHPAQDHLGNAVTSPVTVACNIGLYRLRTA